MTKYFEYRDDIPPVPKELLPTPQQIIDAPYFGYPEEFEAKRPGGARQSYFRKQLSPELKEWVLSQEQFKGESVSAAFIIFNTLMTPHRDVRNETYNFVVDSGGDVYTEFYSKQLENDMLKNWDKMRPDFDESTFTTNIDEIETLESRLIDTNRWHRLQTEFIHGTTGTLSRSRIILSVVKESSVKVSPNPTIDKILRGWFDPTKW